MRAVKCPEQLTLEIEEDDFGAWVESLPAEPFGRDQGEESGQVSQRRPGQGPSGQRRARGGRRSREQDLQDRSGRTALDL
jgi:hypothetical protein